MLLQGATFAQVPDLKGRRRAFSRHSADALSHSLRRVDRVLSFSVQQQSPVHVPRDHRGTSIFRHRWRVQQRDIDQPVGYRSGKCSNS